MCLREQQAFRVERFRMYIIFLAVRKHACTMESLDPCGDRCISYGKHALQPLAALAQIATQVPKVGQRRAEPEPIGQR